MKLKKVFTSKSHGTTASFSKASATIVASTVSEQIIGTVRVDNWRDCLGVAVGSEPVVLANSIAIVITSPVTIYAIVGLHTAYVTVRSVHIWRTLSLTPYAVWSNHGFYFWLILFRDLSSFIFSRIQQTIKYPGKHWHLKSPSDEGTHKPPL